MINPFLPNAAAFELEIDPGEADDVDDDDFDGDDDGDVEDDEEDGEDDFEDDDTETWQVRVFAASP